jgi:hypothetical protein
MYVRASNFIALAFFEFILDGHQRTGSLQRRIICSTRPHIFNIDVDHHAKRFLDIPIRR